MHYVFLQCMRPFTLYISNRHVDFSQINLYGSVWYFDIEITLICYLENCDVLVHREQEQRKKHVLKSKNVYEVCGSWKSKNMFLLQIFTTCGWVWNKWPLSRKTGIYCRIELDSISKIRINMWQEATEANTAAQWHLFSPYNYENTTFKITAQRR